MAAGRVCNVIDLSRAHFEVLRSDDEFILHRGQRAEGPSRVLVLAPVVESPSPESLKRLEHECSVKEELDPAWAARPIGIARHWDRTVLVLEDCGGTARSNAGPRPQRFGQRCGQAPIGFSILFACWY